MLVEKKYPSTLSVDITKLHNELVALGINVKRIDGEGENDVGEMLTQAVIVVEDENADSSQIIKGVILAVRARQKPPTIADEIAELKIRVSEIEATPK